MKKILLTLTFMTIFISTAPAMAKRKAGSICEPRVPVISLNHAISIANKYIITSNINIDENFIDYVSLECKESIHFWVVGYRVKKHETGHYLVYVYMDSSTESSVVKDG